MEKEELSRKQIKNMNDKNLASNQAKEIKFVYSSILTYFHWSTK